MKLKEINWPRTLPYLAGAAALVLLSPFPVLSSIYVFALILFFSFWLPRFYRYTLCAAVITGFIYFSFAGGLKATQFLSQSPSGHYATLAQSMLGGKLSLPYIPDPQLLALPNPYSPEARRNVTYIWDTSFYDGKYFLYFGSAPVISFILPVKLLFGSYPLELTQMLWFTVWAIIFGALFLVGLIETLQRKPANAEQRIFAALLFVFCLPFGALLHRPHIYEVALSAGCAYLMLTLYLGQIIYRAKEMTTKLKVQAAGCGIAFGLAIASRPPLLLAGIVLALYFIFSKIQNKRILVYLFILGLVPLVDWILIYNFLRFGSPFEFGFHYQLNHLRMTEWGWNTKDVIFASLGFLFQWPKFQPLFPYVDLQSFGAGWLSLQHRYMGDGIIGLIFSAPLVLFLYWDREKIRRDRERLILCTLLCLGFGLMIVSAVAGLNIRYELEVFPIFVIVGIAWALAEFQMNSSKLRQSITLLFILFSLQLGFFISLPLELQNLNRAHPTWVHNLIASFGGTIDVVNPKPIAKPLSPELLNLIYGGGKRK